MLSSFEFGLILFFSILGGVLAMKFRQPSILGLIIIGTLVGPNNLGFIKDASLIDMAIEVGAVLLLFTLGIEFSLKSLFNRGLKAFTIAAAKLGIVFTVSYFSAYMLGMSPLAAAYIGVMLSITSTVIVVKVLEQKGMKSEELPLLLAVLIIEDLFAIFALTFFSSINGIGDLNFVFLAGKIGFSLLLIIIAYYVLQKIITKVIGWLISNSAEETITFTSLGICFLMSYLAALFGLSPSVGAFLAGNIVASLPKSDIFKKSIHPFTLTFSSLFFFSIGTIVDFKIVIGSILLILALSIVNILSKVFAIGLGTYVFANLNGKKAVFSGIAMVSVGEFSLLIAKEAKILDIGVDLVSIIASVIITSTLGMALLINHSEKIYAVIRSSIPSRAISEFKNFSTFFNQMSINLMRERVKYDLMVQEINIILRNFGLIIFIFLVSLYFWLGFKEKIILIFPNKFFMVGALLLLVAISGFPAFRVCKNTYVLIKNFLDLTIHKDKKTQDKCILRNFIILTTLLALAIGMPALIFLLNLKPLYIISQVFIVMVITVLFYNTMKKIDSFEKS